MSTSIKKESKIDNIIFLISSLIGVVVAFNFFILSVLKNSSEFSGLISESINSLDIQLKSFNNLIVIIATVSVIVTIIVYFLINRVILSQVFKVKISSYKLLFTILISSIPGPLLGAILLDQSIMSFSNVIFKLLVTLSQPAMMIYLLSGEFESKKKLATYSVVLLVISATNILSSMYYK